MKKAFLPLALAALAGCESVVEVTPPTHAPQLALSYTLSTQAPTAEYQQFFGQRRLYVSTSQGVLVAQRPQGRADATVEVRDASGQVVEQFRPVPTATPKDYDYGYYAPVRGFVGQPGQAYTLRASAPGVAAVEASLALPAPAAIEAARYAPKAPAAGGGDYGGQLAFSIVDPAATADYYVAYARVLDAAGQYWGEVVQDYARRNSDGPDLKLNRFDLSQGADLYRVLPVSDAGRNGQRLSFSNDVRLSYNRPYTPGSPLPQPAFIELIVSSVPAATYEFYQSVQRYYDTDGNPFAEPAPLRSNVPGGYGLFGGSTDALLRIKL